MSYSGNASIRISYKDRELWDRAKIVARQKKYRSRTQYILDLLRKDMGDAGKVSGEQESVRQQNREGDPPSYR